MTPSIDWLGKLRRLLLTLAFCLAISALQFAFRPDTPYEVPLVYSLCIGVFTWALIDMGRHLFASTAETGWPTGAGAVALPMVSIVIGYVLGTMAADRWFGWSSWANTDGARSQLPVSILVTVLAGVSISYYFYTRNKRAQLEKQVSETSRQASEARLKLLETQLEPHMLFNTLANLRVLIGTDPARAQVMLDHIIAYLRATLTASRSSNHSLQAEFDRLRDYLELMAIRMGPRLRYTLELPPALAAVPVPTLLLQPLVENSIKHGLEPKVTGGEVRVSAGLNGGELVLQVTDTGVGMNAPAADARHGEGFGTAQVRERLATTYGDAAVMHFSDCAQGGTCVTIHVPQTV